MSGTIDHIKLQVEQAERYAEQVPRIVLEEQGRKVAFRAANKVSAIRVVTLYSKEPDTIAWIETMGPDTVLFDIGANVGLYTVWAAATRDTRVYAFEPEAGSYALLCANIFDNGLGPRVRAYCLGLSDKAGIGDMLLSSPDAGNSGHQVMVADGETGHPHSQSYPQGVVTRTLDQVVFEDGLPVPTHMKIDVDGLEPAIIDGAPRLLADPALRSLLIELDLKEAMHRALIERIEAAGFTKNQATLDAVLAKTEGGNVLVGNIIFNR